VLALTHPAPAVIAATAIGVVRTDQSNHQKPYPEEFKREAVGLLRTRGRLLAQIARVLSRSHCGGASASRATFAFGGGVVLDLRVGGRFWILLVASIVGIGIATAIVFAVIGAALVAWGVLGALILVGGLLLGFAWVYDRRELRAHEQAVAQDAEHGD